MTPINVTSINKTQCHHLFSKLQNLHWGEDVDFKGSLIIYGLGGVEKYGNLHNGGKIRKSP